MDFIYQLIILVKKWSSYFGLTDRQNFEDTFYQLLHDKNYDEALKFANQYTYLDIDLVYKCKWRNSGITVQSINFVLGQIQDKLWAINECVQTVPISYEACRTLIKFGLKESNLNLLYQLGNEDSIKSSDKYGGKLGSSKQDRPSDKQPLLSNDATDEEIEGLIDFDNLNDQQRELCRCRQDLLRHEHSLFAYESILGDYRTVKQQFDHVFYDEFRRKSPFQACIDYANDGDAHAVEIMLNFYTEDMKRHIMSILSNFPETLSPYQYRNLLPCLRENDSIYEWRAISGAINKEEFDWSSRVDLSSSLELSLIDEAENYEKQFYEENPTLKKYLNPLTGDLLSEWFIERALEMESMTLLSFNATQLLLLGQELNIKNLEETREDLLEFERIVYDCCTEDDIYLCFSDFQSKSEIERLVLITGDSVKSCKDRFRFYILPYLHRRDSKLGFEGKAQLLREYFRKLADSREQICKSIYGDLLDKIECDNFVAEWTKDLDDVIDEIGEEIKTIERTRQAKQLSTMASRTMALGDMDACYDACQLIMKKVHKDCWAHCCQLGMQKQFNNNEAKYKLLAFALAYCNDPDGKMTSKILDYIIELRKRDEKIQLDYLKRNM